MFDGNKNLLSNVHWSKFSIVEGIFRSINLGLLKIVAAFLLSPVLGLFVTGIIGVIRMFGGLILTLRSGFEIYPNNKAVFGSMLTGIITAYITLTPIYVFVLADVSISIFVLMIICGLVPGAIFSKFASRGKLNVIQIIGLVAVLAGLWIVVGGQAILTSPIWVWMVISLPFVSLIKEIILRKIGTAGVISPWVHNFWAGISMVIFSVIGISTFNVSILTEGLLLNNLSGYLWMVILSGLLYLAIVFARQKSFSVMGGVFAKKRLLMVSVTLITSLIIDLIFFGIVPSFLFIFSLIVILGGYILIEGLFKRSS